MKQIIVSSSEHKSSKRIETGEWWRRTFEKLSKIFRKKNWSTTFRKECGVANNWLCQRSSAEDSVADKRRKPGMEPNHLASRYSTEERSNISFKELDKLAVNGASVKFESYVYETKSQIKLKQSF